MSAMKPLLAITMGDPTGVGPEIIAKAWQDDRVHSTCRAVVMGHPEIMRRAVQLVQGRTHVVPVDRVEQGVSSGDCMPCVSCCANDVVELTPAQVAAGGGEAAYQAVMRACQLARARQVDALVTAPLNKAALVAAGHEYPGHTELLADLCGVQDVAMMLYLARHDPIGHDPGRQQVGLGVAHVTLHVALREVFQLLSIERILRTAQLAHVVTRAMFVTSELHRSPRIGVCALNPHAGESGLFGDEEQVLIRPAVEQGRAAGLDLHGPYPADTLLSRAAAGDFDAVVAMYHDQGHIALKLLTMHQAVNITLGLPVVRTSVAHGTAFDLAWQGKAQCESMVAAIEAAAKLVQCRDHLNWSL